MSYKGIGGTSSKDDHKRMIQEILRIDREEALKNGIKVMPIHFKTFIRDKKQLHKINLSNRGFTTWNNEQHSEFI